jgi:hypothetical protein
MGRHDGVSSLGAWTAYLFDAGESVLSTDARVYQHLCSFDRKIPPSAL